MAALQYVPSAEAGWVVMATGSSVLFLGAGATQERVAGLWNAMSSEHTLQTLLDELTRGGISHTPSFALLLSEGDFQNANAKVHAVARGPVSVDIHREGGVERLSGTGTTTWAEATVTAVSGFEAAPDGVGEQLTVGSRQLPLSDGAAFALRISTRVTTDANESSAVPPPPQPPAPSPMIEPLKTSAADVSDIDDATITMAALAEATIMEPRVEPALDPIPESPAKAQTPEPILVPRPEPAGSGESGYDYLFGQTIARTVEDAAVRVSEDESDESTEAISAPVEGDHDGKTSVGVDQSARQAARRARAEKAAASRPAAPAMAIDFSTGSSELLDQTILIGRAPSVSKVTGASLPRLVTIAGPDQDISRNHAQVAFEGGTVVITDMHSRNGTMVTLPGRAPLQLRAGEPTPVIPGTIVDLGAGVTFTVREL